MTPKNTLRDIRRSLGLTQRDLAGKLDLPFWRYHLSELNSQPLPKEARTKLSTMMIAAAPTRSRQWTPRRLTKLMEEKDLNQNRLAIQLGVTRQTVSMWMKGDYAPGLKQAVKLERIAKEVGQ